MRDFFNEPGVQRALRGATFLAFHLEILRRAGIFQFSSSKLDILTSAYLLRLAGFCCNSFYIVFSIVL